MKFKPGDPVWARSVGQWNLPVGELPGIVTGYCSSHMLCYTVDIPYKLPVGSSCWCSMERHLRPRRDDYQQHEGLGSMDSIYMVDDVPILEVPELDELECLLIEMFK